MNWLNIRAVLYLLFIVLPITIFKEIFKYIYEKINLRGKK